MAPPLLLLSWLPALLALGPSSPPHVRYDDHAIVTAWVENDDELAMLRRIADELWSERPGPGAVDARIAPGRMQQLRATGLEFEIRISNVQSQIDLERARLTSSPTAHGADWFSDFRDLSEIQAKLQDMVAAAPDRVELQTIGESLEGRPIEALRIGYAATSAPAVLYTGTMHAREWLATMATMCVANTFATSDDPAVLDLIERVGVWVVPVINPDGYEISWTSDRYWRKNARDGYGVDLNRNWGYQWALVGSSADPYEENYHGEGPFSEPESAALRDFMIEQPGIAAHIDFHSYSQLILRPWGYGYDIPADEATLSLLGQQMSDAMWAATSTDYPSIHAAELYPAAGAVDDWSYGERGVMSFTIEMRGDDFVVPPSQIDPACRENVAAALAVAQWVAQMTPPSDDGGASDETGHEPPPHDEGGDTSADGGGTAGDGANASADDNGGDGGGDDEGDGNGDGGDADALPPGFGLGAGEGEGCACGSDPRGAPWGLAVLLFVRRRRRTNASPQGT